MFYACANYFRMAISTTKPHNRSQSIPPPLPELKIPYEPDAIDQTLSVRGIGSGS